MTFLWSSCVVVALACGFLAGMLAQQTYFAPPPIIYHTPPVRVESAAITGNCLEIARACYARKRSEAIR